MLEIIQSGGILMWPLILCSILAVAISAERFWTLRKGLIAPADIPAKVKFMLKSKQLNNAAIKELRDGSALGRVLAAGLVNASKGREIMKESIMETASIEVHKMERYLNALGTIASISPLMGLLGTVFGMIEVFNQIVLQGTGNAGAFAGGISEALISTAAGLVVAIPTLVSHRVLTRRVEELVVFMEQEATKLVDVLQGDRIELETEAA
ncbi:MAG: MotA/TolQ/ExbB proton channel family protein [Venatoribacter sp.]